VIPSLPVSGGVGGQVARVGYCVAMFDDAEQVAVVTDDDVERIRVQLRPGSVHPATLFFTLYVRLMEADRRPIAHRTSLGHALRRAGFIHHRARRRIKGVQEEIASWVVPGAPPVDEEGDRMGHVLRSLGPGIHSNALIWQRYTDLAREHGWAWTMSERQLSFWLTKHHFVKQPGKMRFVPPEKIPSA
jgi:hypothetical protein